MRDLYAILGLAAAAALCSTSAAARWALVQRLALRADPANPGVKRDCGGTCNGCDKSCDE